MANGLVPHHWMVAAYTPADPTNSNSVAVVGTASVTYAALVDAQNQARALAAASPGTIYVVYEAEWYAVVDATPVKLWPVAVSI